MQNYIKYLKKKHMSNDKIAIFPHFSPTKQQYGVNTAHAREQFKYI